MSDVHTLTKLLELVIGTKDERRVREARDRAISLEAEAETREADERILAKRHLRSVPKKAKPKPDPRLSDPRYEVKSIGDGWAEILPLSTLHQNQL